MSMTTDTWLQLYRSQTEACGALYATINGQQVQSIISALTSDQVFAAGGQADAGGYSVQVLSSSVPVPSKGDPILVNGSAQEVGVVKNNNGILYIEAVDFVSQE